MDRIRLREPRFDERAYLFVLGALEYCQRDSMSGATSRVESWPWPAATSHWTGLA